MSILGVLYENRSLVDMAETLEQRDPIWVHSFASDLDCLNQYKLLRIEVVVTNPIAKWEDLATDQKALWQCILELSVDDLNDQLAAANYPPSGVPEVELSATGK